MNNTQTSIQQALAQYRASKGSGTPSPVVPSAPVNNPAAPVTPTDPSAAQPDIATALNQYRTAKASGTPLPTTPPASNPSFLDKAGGFVKSLVEAPATIVARPIEAAAVGGAQLFGGNDAAKNTSDALDSFAKNNLGGFVAPIPKNAADVEKDVGRGAQTVAYGLPGLASSGALFGAGSSLEQGNKLLSLQTALQTAIGAGGAKLIGLIGQPLLSGAGKVIGKITPDVLSEVASKGVSAISEFAARHGILPDAASGAVSTAANTAEKVASAPFTATSNAVTAAAKALTDKSETQLENDVVSRFNKGVKPSATGKSTAGQVGKFEDNIVNAVKTINENKGSLSFADDAGNAIAGQNPKSLQQLSDAVDQTKKTIFQKYNALATAAGDKGLVVSTKPVTSELDNIIDNKAIQLTNPKAIEYAKAAKLRYGNSGDLDPQTAQEAISSLNQSLKAFYRNPSYDTASQAGIDSLIANNLRKSLDEGIEGLTSPGYADLKRQYGSLSSIEKDVVKASLRNAKKSTKGLLDFTDVLSGGQLAHGILTMNPALIGSGLTQKGIAALYEHLNNPNRAIAKMFESVEKLPVRAAAKAAEKPSLFALPEGNSNPFQNSKDTMYVSPEGKASTNLKDVISKKIIPLKDSSNTLYATPKGKISDIFQEANDVAATETGAAKNPRNRQGGYSPIKTLAAGATVGGLALGASKLKNMFDNSSTPTALAQDVPTTQEATSTPAVPVAAPEVVKTVTLPGGRIVHTLDSGTKVVDIHPDVEKALATTYKNNPDIPPGVLEALLMKESSGGYDDSNKNTDIGKYAWLGGIAGKSGAKAELDRQGIKYNLNTIPGTLDAMAKYWEILENKKSNQGKTPDEIYDDGGYSNGKLDSDDIDKFKDFVQYYSSKK